MSKKVLIIGSKSHATRRLLYELKQKGFTAQIADPSKFVLAISERIGNDKIYYDGKRIYKNSVDFIINRIGSNFEMGLKVVQHLTNNLHIPSTSSADGLKDASDKFKASQILSEHKIKTPKSVYFENADRYKLLIRLAGGYPVVAKLLTGSQGKGVFILNEDLSGSTTLGAFTKVQRVLLQQYIETSNEKTVKSDIRAFVVMGKVVAAMRRYSVKGDFRSNYSISKKAEKVKLTDNQEKLAIEAAKAFKLEICGVDIITDPKNNIDYVLEINGNPGIGLEKVTGINVNESIAESIKSIFNPKGAHSYNSGLSKFKYVDPFTADAMQSFKRGGHQDEEIFPSDLEFIFDDPDTGISINTPIPEDDYNEEFQTTPMYDVTLNNMGDIQKSVADGLMTLRSYQMPGAYVKPKY